MFIGSSWEIVSTYEHYPVQTKTSHFLSVLVLADAQSLKQCPHCTFTMNMRSSCFQLYLNDESQSIYFNFDFFCINSYMIDKLDRYIKH